MTLHEGNWIDLRSTSLQWLYDNCPIGSTLLADDREIIVGPDGAYDPLRSVEPIPWTNLATVVTSTGAVVTTVGGVAPLTEQQFRQFIHTLSVGQGVLHSVSGVGDALASIGIERDVALRPGMFVHVYDSELMQSLPNGTILQFGFSDRPNLHQLVRIHHGEVRLIFGRRSAYSLLQVVSYPEGTPVQEWDSPREDEATHVQALRRRIYEVGATAKSLNGWCSSYDDVVHRIFIDSSVTSVTEPTPWQIASLIGSVVDLADRLPDLPVGSVAYFTSGDNWWYFYRHSMSGEADGWRRLVSNQSYGEWDRRCEVVHVGGGEVAIPVRSHAEMDLMPRGTQIRAGEEAVVWTKGGDGCWFDPTERSVVSGQFTLHGGTPPVYVRMPSMQEGQDAVERNVSPGWTWHSVHGSTATGLDVPVGTIFRSAATRDGRAVILFGDNRDRPSGGHTNPHNDVFEDIRRADPSIDQANCWYWVTTPSSVEQLTVHGYRVAYGEHLQPAFPGPSFAEAPVGATVWADPDLGGSGRYYVKRSGVWDRYSPNGRMDGSLTPNPAVLRWWNLPLPGSASLPAGLTFAPAFRAQSEEAF